MYCLPSVSTRMLPCALRTSNDGASFRASDPRAVFRASMIASPRDGVRSRDRQAERHATPLRQGGRSRNHKESSGMSDAKLERHRTGRIGWLRAAVLGANDGILSTSSLVVGV